MKAGARAIGIAESYRDPGGPPTVGGSDSAGRSTLAAAVVRADKTVDGFAFGECTVGGTDATRAMVALVEELAREDVQYVIVSGIAPAWYNVVDLPELRERTRQPIIAVSFEASKGLEPALREAFTGDALAERLKRYRRQPPRDQLRVNDETVYVRGVGLAETDARDVVRAFTPEGGRPEPVRVARLAARAADRWRSDS